MKNKILLFVLPFLILGCTSAKILSQQNIPTEKSTVYISLDNTEASVGSIGYISGNFIFTGSETASFNTLDNRMIIKEQLTAKGYKVTNKIENAELILLGGCESSEVQSVVTLVLVDYETEEEYCILRGTYGMGMDLKGDMKGALKNALKNLPTK